MPNCMALTSFFSTGTSVPTAYGNAISCDSVLPEDDETASPSMISPTISSNLPNAPTLYLLSVISVVAI